MKTRHSVSGLRELGEAMKALGGETAKKIATSMTGAGATVVKNAAINNAPQYHEVHVVGGVVVAPGNLKKNIVAIKLRRTNLTAESAVTVRNKRKDGYAAWYGRMVEFGTVKMSAQPFLRPALAENVGKAVEAMKKKGAQRIQAEVRKVAKARAK